MKPKRFQKPSAFTLIELIVVVVIILTLSGLGIVGYNKFNQRQVLIQAALNIRSDLRDAQNRASAGEKDTSIVQCVTGDLNYWAFEIDSSLTQYSIYGLCGGSKKIKEKIVTLASGLKFSASATVLFKPLSSGTSLSTIRLDNNTTNQYIEITINPSGDIILGEIKP